MLSDATRLFRPFVRLAGGAVSGAWALGTARAGALVLAVLSVMLFVGNADYEGRIKTQWETLPLSLSRRL